MEKTIIKLFQSRKLKGQTDFTNYDKALTYAKRKSEEGYTCLILRVSNDKEWVKFWLNPPETL